MDWIDALGEAWEREYPGVDVSTLPPLVRLARLSLLIESFQQEVLEPFELTRSDYGVLAMLRRAGAPYEASPSDLTNRLLRSSGGMTKILKRLASAGYVERIPDPADGRVSWVRLTAAGHEVQDRAFAAFLAATRELLAPLSTAELRDADGSLKALLDAFEPRPSV